MAQKNSDTSYVDAKGRTRWRRNEWLAERFRELGEFLIIGDYEESHAAVYKRLSYVISRYPESVETLHAEFRLKEIPDVGPTIAVIVKEYLETGTCGKFEEWAEYHPISVLEMLAVPGLGAKMVRTLFMERCIKSLRELEQALDTGQLDRQRGLGKKTVANIRAHIQKLAEEAGKGAG